jgi:hypothetical protein
MPARRRRTLDRSPIRRAQMWDKKMSGEIYATLLPPLKELAMPKITGYQATHETLIANVKSALSNFPSETPLLQEYMWYAEKLWKFTQHYGSQALQKEADALYLWYLARGRNDITLRMVARALGIKISALEDIVEKTLSPIMLKVIGRGTITTDGTEQVIIEYTGSISSISGYIDLSNMVDGDSITIKAYVKIKENGDYVLYRPETYSNKQTEPALYVMPRLSGYAFKVTIQQTQGSYKNFDYLFVKGV